ncbi:MULTISPECIES: hypothetical protein [Streptomyces]|uniref:hypothetical protein n=1 Tax=Streptomyces TaxID=1883 RepID=UPI000E687BD3|nr:MULTISPECIES: hypothetical protein [Streptomyces]MDX3064753.1 hypothetical protein [Streptomyces sp. ND04-05B]MDX3519605.1 hypothetical protein [Streptomyces scabiei]
MQYRADYSNAESYTPLGLPCGDLAEAQGRCENALRSAWPEGDQLEITWRADADPASLWTMLVRTPRLERPAAIGYSVTIVGSVFDSPQELAGLTPAVDA